MHKYEKEAKEKAKADAKADEKAKKESKANEDREKIASIPSVQVVKK